jgi:methionyl aminopeptidase
VNLSINHEAAHYSASILDDRIVPDKAIVKIDLGAHIDGYLVDTAITVNHDHELEELTKASKVALEKALKVIKPGLKVDEVGKIVEQTIEDYGFQPIRNLSGHQIKKFILHAGVSVPNTGPKTFGGTKAKFEAGRIYAIEPFASTGEGWVKNDRVINIFRYVKDPKNRDKELHEISRKVKKVVGPLPFSPRHLHDKNSGKNGKEEVTRSIRRLLRANVLTGYPVLIEADKSLRVSQYEETVRITQDGCEILTQP